MSLRRRKTLADELNEIRSRVNKLETGTELRDDSITLNTIRSVKERYNLLDTNSLSLWLTMNGSARDKSINKLHGTLVGSPAFVDGKDSSAIDFDGFDDEITVPSDALLNIASGNDISFSFWVKTSETGPERDIINKGVAADFYLVRITDDVIAGGVRCQIFDASDSALRYSATAINDGVFHHIVATYDASTGIIKIYVDGLDDSSATLQSNQINQVVSNSDNFNVGKGVISGGFFDGVVDEVRVYKRLLSDVEALELFTFPKPQPHQFEPHHKLIAFYPFEGHAEDMSGFVKNGTRVGNPVYVDGKLGKALDFDTTGTDDITLPSIPLNLLTDSFTFLAWIKVTHRAPVPSFAAWSIIINFADIGFSIFPNSASQFGVKAWVGGNATTITTAAMTYGVYHLIAVTYVGVGSASRDVFLDNVNVGTDTGGTAADFTGTMSIGGNPYTDIPEGEIDEVRIYNRVLSPTELTELFNNIRPSLRDFTMEEEEAVASGSSSGACTAFYIGTNPGGANDCDLIIGNQWSFL